MADGLYLDQLIDEQNKQSEAGTETSQQSEEVVEEKKEATETTTEQEAEGDTGAEVTPYTPEEFEQLLKTDGQVDFRRLTTEGQAIWKSVDRGLKPKLEEAAQLRKQFETYQQTVPQQQYAPQQTQQTPRTLYEAFYQNPDQVLQTVRDRLYQSKLADPYSEDVVKLEQLRDDLTDRRSQISSNQMRAKMVMDEANTAVRQAIPDYETKREELTKFATTLGLSDQELSTLCNPLITGPTATKLTLAINSLYDKIHSGNLKKKEVKEAIKVEKAGSGFEQKKEKEWDSREDYVRMRNQSLL